MKLRLILLIAGLTGSLQADPALDHAIQLYHSKQYPAAQAALEKIVATEPQDAAACYYLGLTLRHRGGGSPLEAALPWLEKAATLAPANTLYLGDYGGTCLQLANKHSSLSFANRGRAAMEQAIRLDPGYLDAREGLMQFYAQAPWPLGDTVKAQEQAGEILRRDAARGLHAYLVLGRSLEKAGRRDEALEAFATVLKLDPQNSAAAAALVRLKPQP